ncbi:ArsR/SmtB family transcription factor [Janibacter sp. GS2]|uniref:ArsR/SmtB family transcription factor n=1 Tax=Janibacter sp. GS2 TaxID=3442646 RepID=UPI003EBC39FD
MEADTPRNSPSRDHGVRRITEAAVLSAIAHPFRNRILDALKVDGPSTASSLSKRTGQAVGSVSHHLKVLADVGLVEEVPELARDRRERWWRLVSAGFRWSRSDLAGDPVAAEAGAAAESISLTRQVERKRAWMDNSEAAGQWGDTAFATQQWLHLTPGELDELSAEIIEVLTRWSARAAPDDDAEREPVFVFAHGFPSQP